MEFESRILTISDSRKVCQSSSDRKVWIWSWFFAERSGHGVMFLLFPATFHTIPNHEAVLFSKLCYMFYRVHIYKSAYFISQKTTGKFLTFFSSRCPCSFRNVLKNIAKFWINFCSSSVPFTYACFRFVSSGSIFNKNQEQSLNSSETMTVY